MNNIHLKIKYAGKRQLYIKIKYTTYTINTI